MKHKLTDLEKRVNYYAGIICIGQLICCLIYAFLSAKQYKHD